MANFSVGSNARDYPDTDAFIADLPATLVEQMRAQHYNDSEFTSSSVINVAGITTTPAFNIVLECAAGESFRDNGNHLRYDQANGVAIRKTSAYSSVMSISVPHTELIGLQIASTGVNNTIGLSETTNITVDGCLISSASNGRAVSSSGAASVYINTVIIVEDGAAAGTDGMRCSYTAPTLVNCTFISLFPGSTGFGVEKLGGTANNTIVKNNAIFGFGTALESGSWGVGTDYNATDNATLPAGSNNLTSLITSDQFEDVASDATLDLRLKAGNSLDGAGVPDALTNDEDIFFTTRSLTTPSIGAYETPSGGGVSLDLDVGSILFNGDAVPLKKTSLINLSTGNLSFSGSQLSLIKNSAISIDTGTLSLSGNALNITKNSVLGVESGSLSFIGDALSLVYTPISGASIDLDTGQLNLSGNDLVVGKGSVVDLSSGQLSITGGDLDLLTNKSIDLSSGVLSLSGESLGLIKSKAIGIDGGLIILSGSQLSLVYSGLVVVEVDNFNLSYTNDTIQLSYSDQPVKLSYTENQIKLTYT